MGLVNITGFQRMRRLHAEKEAEKAKVSPDKENAVNEQNEPLNAELNINELSVDEVKARLDELGVQYAHNTGEKKLREKLSDAVNG